MSNAPETYVDSMAGSLRRVAMRRPGAMLTADHERWHYAAPIDAVALQAQYDTFTGLVIDSGAEIIWFDDADDDLADSVFTFDPSFMVHGQAVVMRPGKTLRSGEAALHRSFYEANGIPVLGQIEAPGTMEGGDCIWLDASTLVVGRGFRTNQSGIDQLRELVSPLGIEVIAFDLPYYTGPDACLHLMSLVSPLDDDLALVYAQLLPTALHGLMNEAGYELLHAPHDEFVASQGLSLNVLATGPRQVIAIDGFPQTAEQMVNAGCDLTRFQADALCIPCEGGPTCLTRPLLRK